MKLIEKKSGEYLNAEIKIGRLDYSFRHTYPWLMIEVDSLMVISKSLDDVTPQVLKHLPVYADTLATIVKFKGSVNIHSLLKEQIQLRGIEVVRPDMNIVVVSDTVSNFNILKNHLPDNLKKPEIDVTEIKIIAPVRLNFFSLAQDVDASLTGDNFYLNRETEKTYKIGFDGVVNGRYQDYSLQGDVPLKFTTEFMPVSPDFAVNLDNLSLAYGGLRLDLAGNVKAHGEGVDLKDVKLNASIDDVFDFLHYLPAPVRDKIKIPSGISGKIPVNFIVNLLAPYKIDKEKFKSFTFQELPHFSAVVKIEDADLHLLPPGSKKIDANDVYLVMECNFDPYDSHRTNLTIAEFRMNGEGISMHGMAHISNLTGENQEFNGMVNFRTPLVESMAYFLPSSPVNVSGVLGGNVNFSGTALDFGKKGLKALAMSGDLESSSLKVKPDNSSTLKISNMKTDFQAKIPGYPLNDYAGTKLGFDFSADSVSSNAGGARLMFTGLRVSLDATDTVAGSPDPYGTLSMAAKSLKAETGGNKFMAKNISIDASGSLNSSGSGSYTTVAATHGLNDGLIASRISHTPLVVEYSGGGILSTVMGMVNLQADVRIENGNFNTPQYLYPVEFSGVDLTTDLNRMKLQANTIRLADTGFSLWTEITGLKPFLTSYSATPLQASADINFSNVNINQLSWGYYGSLIAKGEKPDSVFYISPLGPFTASDSVCVAIPRNIDARITLSSDSAECLQYKFAPLSTDIILKDGDATLSRLTVGAPYCTAVVDWKYSTSQLDNIYMDLQAQVKNFNLSQFYPIFPSLGAKAPEIKDFTGRFDANIGCRFDMYPDMFMNPESLTGNFDIKGTQLQFARKGKIERLTHLMLIEGDAPISIDNLHISGALHDNLLQVNPFKISFDDYQLGFAGVNNLAGGMYYHIALEKSPFHLPFGVSLKGSFSHPEVRVGGTHIDANAAEDVASDLSSNLNVNIMAYLRHGWQLFIQEAAKYCYNEHK